MVIHMHLLRSFMSSKMYLLPLDIAGAIESNKSPQTLSRPYSGFGRNEVRAHP
jgi:hypothetical protein